MSAGLELSFLEVKFLLLSELFNRIARREARVETLDQHRSRGVNDLNSTNETEKVQ
jgi:hypothetical protein